MSASETKWVRLGEYIENEMEAMPGTRDKTIHRPEEKTSTKGT